MNEELKEQKPKKVFTITIDIYDTGDIDSSMVEHRMSPTGLGRPRKWEMTAVDFVKRVEEIYGNYEAMLEDCTKAIGKGSKDVLGFKANNVGGVQIAVVPRPEGSIIPPLETETPTESPDSKKSDPVEDDDKEMDDGSDMDFGEFDPNK